MTAWQGSGLPRIVSDIPDEIVIEDRPRRARRDTLGIPGARRLHRDKSLRSGDRTVLIAGAILTAGTGIALLRAIRHVRLVLRRDGAATLTVRGPRGITRRTFLPGTLRAGLATDRSEDETHRVILLAETAAGLERLPLTVSDPARTTPP